LVCINNIIFEQIKGEKRSQKRSMGGKKRKQGLLEVLAEVEQQVFGF
jgi:hypothetical protein